MLKRISRVFTLLAFVLVVTQPVFAQWGIGADYEIRDKDPKNGFGVRVDRQIKLPLPLVHLGTRAHFSYFNEDNNFDINNPSGSFSYSREIKNYDFGIALLGGVSLGLIEPYVGLGLGSETVDLNYKDVSNLPSDQQDQYQDGNKSKVFYNGFFGAELSPIPLLNPFIEYRFSHFNDPFKINKETVKTSNGRLIFGVMLRF